MKVTNLNGVDMALRTAQVTAEERIEAKTDYIAMMCDVDIPTDEGGIDDAQ